MAATLVAVSTLTLYRVDATANAGALLPDPVDPTGDGAVAAAGATGRGPEEPPTRRRAPATLADVAGASSPPTPPRLGLCATNLTLHGPAHPCVSFERVELLGSLSIVATRRLRETPGEWGLLIIEADLLLSARHQLTDVTLSARSARSLVAVESPSTRPLKFTSNVHRHLGTLRPGEQRQVRIALAVSDPSRFGSESLDVAVKWSTSTSGHGLLLLPIPDTLVVTPSTNAR